MFSASSPCAGVEFYQPFSIGLSTVLISQALYGTQNSFPHFGSRTVLPQWFHFAAAWRIGPSDSQMSWPFTTEGTCTLTTRSRQASESNWDPRDSTTPTSVRSRNWCSPDARGLFTLPCKFGESHLYFLYLIYSPSTPHATQAGHERVSDSSEETIPDDLIARPENRSD